MRFLEDGSTGGANARSPGYARPVGSAFGAGRAEARTAPQVVRQSMFTPSIGGSTFGWPSRSADIRRAAPPGAWRKLNWPLIMALLLNSLAWWGILALAGRT